MTKEEREILIMVATFFERMVNHEPVTPSEVGELQRLLSKLRPWEERRPKEL